MNDQKIKLCPFCGKRPRIKLMSYGCDTRPATIRNDFVIKCDYCGVHTKTFTSNIFQKDDGTVVIRATGTEEAIDAWNTRVME